MPHNWTKQRIDKGYTESHNYSVMQIETKRENEREGTETLES